MATTIAEDEEDTAVWDMEERVTLLMTEKYEAELDRIEELSINRRMGEANDLWLSIVPDAEKSAVDYFLLGNVLFSALPEKALELMQTAARMEPESPMIQLELGMLFHRNGNYKDAAIAYDKFLQPYLRKSGDPGVFGALLADCHIHTGDFEKACDAWELLTYHRYRIGIAQHIHAIYGKIGVFQRHFDLLVTARNKDIDAAARLILLDCLWEDDWWNSDVNREFLKADAEEILILFPADDPRVMLMRAIAEYHLDEEPESQKFKRALTSQNVILGDSPTLPEHGLLVSHGVNLILQDKLESPKGLLKLHRNRFESELQKPAEEIDPDLVNVYAHLLLATGRSEELNRVNGIMWKKFRDPRLSTSYLVGILADGRGPKDPEISEVMKQFPEDKVTCELALKFAHDEGLPLAQPLANLIAAEFRMPSPDALHGEPSADKLHALFGMLRKELSKESNDK